MGDGAREGMSETNTKVLVVGLDGATRVVLEPVMQRGLMPRLARLVSEGFLGDLTSVRPPVTGPAWISFMTGVEPGAHGIYSFTRSVDGSYRRQVIHGGLVDRPLLWSQLSAAGKRVGVVNVPVTYPPPEVNGVMVTGMLTPSHRKGFTHPPGFAAELIEKFGSCEMDVEWQGSYGPSRQLEFIEEIDRTTVLTADIALEAMARGPWDFFMTVFTGTDRLQHLLWDVVVQACDRGPDDPAGDPPAAAARYFQSLDEQLGRLLDAAGPEANVLVLSDHGFGRLEKIVYMNEWLRQEGLLSVSRQGFTLREAVKKLDVFNLRKHLSAPRTQDPSGNGNGLCIDWPNTTAFFASHTEQGLHLNVRGRQPEGTVQPDQYEQVRADLMERLSKLQDPATGENIVSEMFKREEIYRGAHVDTAPDIVFSLQHYGYLADVGFPGEVFRNAAEIGKGSGSHRMEGILAGAGPAFRKAAPVENATITDLAPTVLHLLEQPLPSDLDGKVLQDLLADVSRRTVLEAPVESNAPAGMAATNYSAEEEAALRERLRGLGYMD